SGAHCERRKNLCSASRASRICFDGQFRVISEPLPRKQRHHANRAIGGRRDIAIERANVCLPRNRKKNRTCDARRVLPNRRGTAVASESTSMDAVKTILLDSLRPGKTGI